MGARDVTVSNPDGQTVVLTGGFTVTPPPPTLGLAFLGKLRDKVGQGNGAFSADGALDGSFRVTRSEERRVGKEWRSGWGPGRERGKGDTERAEEEGTVGDGASQDLGWGKAGT